ncbi:lasso peptide biosynthesis B2 protein [Sphingorhabdus soli]|uniref:Lasso peptide biosynthesis B2 protein n=1 Tax=Flavisphingopyxis soli TaxID=2601267 RepID=A0A5C6ULD9_9SPHN|nr:lasso peptide biosynthesis B2 protein [Sphingorhabdus soli]TXC73284.1 lasso peptide biosynthesis B2 protein [Sphingorhabdus soli]
MSRARFRQRGREGAYLANRTVSSIVIAMGVGAISKVVRRSGAWVEAVSALAVARLLVRFVPFRFWRRTIGPIAPPEGDEAPLATDNATLARARSVGRHVRRTASRMPFEAVCLPQAMAARWMLRRRNIATQIHFGARPGQDAQPFDLHAWLMLGGVCLTGQEELASYRAFTNRRSDS